MQARKMRHGEASQRGITSFLNDRSKEGCGHVNFEVKAEVNVEVNLEASAKVNAETNDISTQQRLSSQSMRMKMDPSPSNEECMLAYQKGDSKAFKILYDRISGRIYSYLRKRLQRQEFVDECFQMVFEKLHKSRSQYDPTYSVEQWMYVIAKSTILDHFRKQNRDIKIEDETLLENLETPHDANALGSAPLSISSYASSSTPDFHEERELPLGPLSPQQRKIVEWKVLDQISYEEIAKRLDQSEINIRQIFSRSLKKLRLLAQKEGKL